MAVAPECVVIAEHVEAAVGLCREIGELCIAVERAFALPPLGQEALAGVRTVGDLVDLVRTQKDRS